MDWAYRSQLLAREFILMNADVICLQEVQSTHYTTFYQPFFGTCNSSYLMIHCVPLCILLGFIRISGSKTGIF